MVRPLVTASRSCSRALQGRPVVLGPRSVLAGPQRHDVARVGRRWLRRGLVLGEDGGGEGELGDLVAQVADLLALAGDGLAELVPVPRNCAPLTGRTSTWTQLHRASWSGARSAPAATPRPESHAALSNYRNAASIRSSFTAKDKTRSVHGVGIGGMTMIWCSPRA
jgi:hypothetical protein